MSHFIYIPLKNQLVEVWRQLCVDLNHFSRLRDQISHQILKAIEQFYNPSNSRRNGFQNHPLLFPSMVCTWRTEHGSWLCGFIFHIQIYCKHPSYSADPSGNPKKLISRMEDAKYCGRDWIPTGNWPQVRYNPAYNRTTPDNLAQVLRCGSSHPSLPLLYLPTSFTLSLSQLGIFQGHYKVWEWLEHIVFMSTSCMFSSHMPYNTLLLHISRNSTHCITRTWHPLSDVVHLTRRDANFHGIAHVGVNRSR